MAAAMAVETAMATVVATLALTVLAMVAATADPAMATSAPRAGAVPVWVLGMPAASAASTRK